MPTVVFAIWVDLFEAQGYKYHAQLLHSLKTCVGCLALSKEQNKLERFGKCFYRYLSRIASSLIYADFKVSPPTDSLSISLVMKNTEVIKCPPNHSTRGRQKQSPYSNVKENNPHTQMQTLALQTYILGLDNVMLFKGEELKEGYMCNKVHMVTTQYHTNIASKSLICQSISNIMFL